MLKPHYVRDYRRMVRALRQADPQGAMERAIGGDYLRIGTLQAELLSEIGLRDGHLLVDVGCGSGRTAFALRDRAIRYHGTDVVPDLIAYAKEKVARPDWRFSVVEGLTVPEKDEAADVISMFSVVTHLTDSEGRHYVADAARVLKRSGVLLVSFLDPDLADHRRAAGSWLVQTIDRLRGRSVKNVLLRPEQIVAWGTALGLKVELFGPERFGQSFALFRKGEGVEAKRRKAAF